MSKDHALLSPSSSHRWLKCSGSILLPDSGIERDTTAADEGTLAHRMAELKLKRDFWYDYEKELAECRNDPLYKPEMDDYTTAYVNFINDFNLEDRLIERKVSMGDDLFGTCDCMMLDHENNKLIIVDFKYGFSKVDAKNNPQLKLYAFGASELLKEIKPGLRIEMYIYQPRIKYIGSDSIDYVDLCSWYYDNVKPAVEKVVLSNLEENFGVWCKYCDKKIHCKEYNDNVLSLNELNQDLKTLTNEEIVKYFESFKELESHLKEIRAYLINQIKNGKEVPGYRLSIPKNRYWKKSKALDDLIQQFNLYNVMTVAQAQKKLTKDEFEMISRDYVETKEGSPKLLKVNK